MLELNKLYLMDCMEGMKTFPDKYFDLAIVDPPYGAGNFSQINMKNRPYSKKYKIEWNDNIPQENYFNELYRISKDRIIWGANYYRPYIKECGSIIWDKVNNSPVGSQCEIASNSKENRVIKYKHIWTGFINESKREKIHPCEKPVPLYKWILNKFAEPDYKIIDTHVGSASSIIAFLDFGCDWIGFEIDEDYHKAASKRIKIHQMQTRLF